MKPYLEITTLCTSCDVCRILCPENSILVNDGKYHVENWSCTLCNICVETCPADSIKLKWLDVQSNVSKPSQKS